MKNKQTQEGNSYTYYLIVLSTSKYKDVDKDVEYADSYCPDRFPSVKKAKEFWTKNYKNRNKKDGYDEHYNQLPFIVEKITETREIINNKNHKNQKNGKVSN